MKCLATVILALFWFCLANSQTKYPDSKVYYEFKKEAVSIEIKNDKLVINCEISERIRFNEYVSSNEEYIHTRSFSEISNIQARIGRLKNNGNHSISKVQDIELKSQLSGSVFYDDNKYYQISFPEINPGDYIEVSYTMKLDEPHFLKRYFFTEYEPVENATFSITTDQNVELGWKLEGNQKAAIKFEKGLEKEQVKYTWTLENVEPYSPESNSPGYLHVATHVVPYIKSYQVETSKVNVLRDVQDLFDWYQSLLKNIKPTDDSELKSLAAEITKNASTDLDKAKAIFYWVQDNIRYIAFEDGWRGFIPYPASEICTKRYGDCKDMTHLMYEMMTSVGLNAQHAWVGTRELPYSYDETPCPSVDNHLVILLNLQDEYYVLDATSAHTPFGTPTSFIISKELLFKKEEGKYGLHQIGTYEADDCVIKDSISVKLNEENLNQFEGTAQKNIETFEFTRFHHRYGAANVDKKKFLDEYLELGQNNFEIIHFEIKELVEREKSRIDYLFEIPGYVKSFGESSFINLNLTRPLIDQKLDPKRNLPFEIDYKRKLDFVMVLTLSESNNVIQIPENFEYASPIGKISASYEKKDDKIIYRRLIQIDKIIVHPEEFEDWNAFISALQKLYNNSIEIS